ncbi:MAG: lipoprotein-releasing ABC transporter permease subunit [Thiotrichales bacterium]|nr:lipoprotein-releasing ABC transporter permease subunit [Thiotrichales bacterium]
MFTPYELCVGLRYTRAKRRNHFISFISLTSMIGIALGATALITVISVMNGFERELRERILGVASHATISAFDRALEDWESLAAAAEAHPEVVGAAPYVESQGMLTHAGQVRGVLIRGVFPSREPRVSEVGRFLVEGTLESLAPGKFNMLIGRDLALRLGATVGTALTLVAPRARITPAGVMPRMRRFTVTGIFEAGHAQYDTSLAVVHVEDAQRVFRLGRGVSGLRVKLADMFDAPRVSRELARSFGGQYWLRDWTQHHANFFRALKIEKTVMFVILTLIVAVAAFNLVSTLVMVVTDKESDIAILRPLGASRSSILSIFIVQGTLIGIAGTIAGVAGGVALAAHVETLVPAIEGFFDTKFLSPDVYYISAVPSDMRWRDVAAVGAVAFVMSVLATIYPAWRASRVQPVEALRHE